MTLTAAAANAFSSSPRAKIAWSGQGWTGRL
jgi:hypothetical protein